MRKLFQFLFLTVIVCSFSSCSLVFTANRKTTLVTTGGGTKIKVLGSNYWSKTDTSFIGIDSVTYKLDHNRNEYLLLFEKPGCKSRTEIVRREQFNAAKLVDIVIPLATTFWMFNTIGDETQEAGVRAGSFFAAAFSWSLPFIGPRKVYKKRILFNSLEPLPQKSPEERFVEVDEVSFNIKEGQYKRKYYNSFKDYTGDYQDYSNMNDKPIQIENTIFDTKLNKLLQRNGYLDTSDRFSLNDAHKVKLLYEVNRITEYKVGEYVFFELNTTVSVTNPLSSTPLFKSDFITRSNLAYSYSSDEDEQYASIVTDALENVFLDMLKDPKARESMNNQDKKIKEILDAWPAIPLQNISKEPISIENSVNSVVTVKLTDGHGSGCIISSDGYVITNYHVVGADTGTYELIFNNGARKKAKLIRTNPLYDLALLKADTVCNTVLKINASKNISIGSDVYAIGTPKDITLGQSITKGIISGKRNFEGKIYIQSDVSVNGGNSGGAMINKEGELIGIVNAKLVGVGVEGVGFAIPASVIEEALKVKIQQ